ncbi:MAG: M48 family metallopeptidase [Planctomycetota bacterium]
MWELIRINRMKSLFLFILMGLCLILLGYFIGMAMAPPTGGYIGLAAAVSIWIVWSLVGYFQGDAIMLSLSGAREVSHNIHPRLFNVVEEMKIAAALPAMPRVYIINEDAPNAFAVGRKPEKSAVAVTTGLLDCMDRDELQGVIAHEISHIHNRDVLFMTFAGIMLGTIVLVGNGFLRAMWYSGGSSRRINSNNGKGGGQAQLIFLGLAVFFAVFAPIMAQLLYFAISRRREYLADASAVRLTRYPEGLASALERISLSTADMPLANKATAPMYIANPIKKEGRALSDVTSTHPPLSERIQILRAMSKGAGLFRYQQAFNHVKGKLTSLVPESALKETTVIPIRKGQSMEGEREEPKKSKRDLNDLKRAVNRFAFLTCAACALKIKIPPEWKRPSFPCPRCHGEIQVPAMQVATVAAVLETIPSDSRSPGNVRQPAAGERDGIPQKTHGSYKRRTQGWETFACDCGKKINLSPIFGGSCITCKDCGAEIIVEKAG